MTRDWNLVRTILLDLSESREPIDASMWTNSIYDLGTVGFHLLTMNEAGLIVANISPANDNPYYVAKAERLTWKGMDFLGTIKSESIWSKVKQRLAQIGGDTAISTIKAIAIDISRSMLGL